MAILRLLVWLTLVALSESAGCYKKYAHYISYGGKEISGATTVDACKNACNDDSGCYGFDFSSNKCYAHESKDMARHSNTAVDQYIKEPCANTGSVASTIPAGCFEKHSNSNSYGGQEISGAVGLEDCKKKCYNDNGCYGFDFSNNKCWGLRSKNLQRHNTNGVDQYIKKSCSTSSTSSSSTSTVKCGPCPSGSYCVLTDNMKSFTCICPGKELYNEVTKNCENGSIRELQSVGCYEAKSPFDLDHSVTWTTNSPQKCINYCRGSNVGCYKKYPGQHSAGGKEITGATSVDACKKACDEDSGCYGFDFNSDKCWAVNTKNAARYSNSAIDQYIKEDCTGNSGYLYAGLEAGNKCNCGNTFGRHGARPTKECNTLCAGNPVFMCGGTNRNSVFRTGYKGCRANSCEAGRKCVNTNNGIWCSCKADEVYDADQKKCTAYTSTTKNNIAIEAFAALRSADYKSVSDFTNTHINPIFADAVRICSSENSNSENCRIAEIFKTMKLMVGLPNQYSNYNNRVVVMTSELRDVNLKTYLNELQDKSVASQLLYDISKGLNTILAQNEAKFKTLSTYFVSVANYDKSIAQKDREFLEGSLTTLKAKSKEVSKKIAEDLKIVMISAITASTLEVAQRTLMLAAEIALQMSGLIDVLPSAPDVNAIADRAGELAQAIIDLADAVLLYKGLNDLAKQGRELAKKFEDNEQQTKNIQKLIDNIDGAIPEDVVTDFIKDYGNYSPKVTTYDMEIFIAKLSKVAEVGCDIFLGQTSAAAKLAEGINQWGKDACNRIEEEIAGVAALYGDIYQYQFDVMDAYAKIVKGDVAKTYATKIGENTAKIDLNGLIQGMILDQGHIQTVATVYCNQLDYTSAGVRASYCAKQYYSADAINKIVSLEGGLEKRANDWMTTTFFPTTTEVSKPGEINIRQLLNKNPVFVSIPKDDPTWLERNKWVKYIEDIRNNVYYIANIEPMMPDLKCAQSTRFTVNTSPQTSIYDTDTSTVYSIDKKSFLFDYNLGSCSSDYKRTYKSISGSEMTKICSESRIRNSERIPTSLYNARWTLQFKFTGCSQADIDAAISKVKELPVLVTYKYLIISENERGGSLDFCYPNPCKNGGACGKDPNKPTFKCHCAYGASGDTCDSLPDRCASKICIGGQCENTIGGAKCTCGEYEPYGIQNQCVPNNCATQGCGNEKCTNTAFKAECLCPTGQEYVRTEEKCKWVKPCDREPSPCGEHSTCSGQVPNTQKYQCGCLPRFKKVGDKCIWENICLTRSTCDVNANSCIAYENTSKFTCDCNEREYMNVNNKCEKFLIARYDIQYKKWQTVKSIDLAKYGDFSACVNFKLNDFKTGRRYTLLGDWRNPYLFLFEITEQNQLSLWMRGSDVEGDMIQLSGGNVATTHDWQQACFAWVKTPGIAYIYNNGQIVAAQQTQFEHHDLNYNTYATYQVGWKGDTYDEFLNGEIDYVGFYNRHLTQIPSSKDVDYGTLVKTLPGYYKVYVKKSLPVVAPKPKAELLSSYKPSGSKYPYMSAVTGLDTKTFSICVRYKLKDYSTKTHFVVGDWTDPGVFAFYIYNLQFGLSIIGRKGQHLVNFVSGFSSKKGLVWQTTCADWDHKTGTAYIYNNGVLVGARTTTESDHNLRIGNHPTYEVGYEGGRNVNFFNGEISDVKIYEGIVGNFQ